MVRPFSQRWIQEATSDCAGIFIDFCQTIGCQDAHTKKSQIIFKLYLNLGLEMHVEEMIFNGRHHHESFFAINKGLSKTQSVTMSTASDFPVGGEGGRS